MRDELVNECLKLKKIILTKCKEIGSYDENCANMMKVVFDNIDSPQNSEEAIKSMKEDDLQALLRRYNLILTKIDATVEKMNIAQAKMNPPKIDEKKRNKELMIQAIFNRLYYFRYRILSFFGIEIK